MKIVAYAGGEFLTGDEIAEALLEYSAALAEAGSAGSIDIPVIVEDGRRVTATFLVGPSSQIVATDADASVDELTDDEVIERLRGLVRTLRPVAVTEDDGLPYADDFDG